MPATMATEVDWCIDDDWKPAPAARDDMKLLLEIQIDSWARLRQMYVAADRKVPREVEFYEYTYEKMRQLVTGIETGKFRLVKSDQKNAGA